MSVKRCGSALAGGIAAVLLLSLAHGAGGVGGPSSTSTAPPNLQDTGLYSDFAQLEVDERHLAFAPQYPLWTDGALKRRWLSLPPGAVIDGSDPDHWVFPVGTRFWKEFSFDGQKVETRYLELLADGTWLYAAYAWSADERSAELVSEKGKRGAWPLAHGRSHTIPSVSDCKVCHEAGRTAVLGFSALQLSPDKDPGALHEDMASAADLDYLIRAGLLVGFPEAIRQTPPRITTTSATERAAIGYMHGNCGHCHDRQSKLENLGLFLRFDADTPGQPARASTLNQPVRKSAPGQSAEAMMRVEPGHPERSALAERMGSRYAALQMPPLGTELVDEEAVALIRQWIIELEDVSGQTGKESEQ